jgi:PHD/YefM family antitoxin component YafN of YafNO toxin-antitoxin module
MIVMTEASAADVARNFGAYREIAEGHNGPAEPVMVLHYNKPSVVILSAAEYERLKSRDKQAAFVEDTPEWIIEEMERQQHAYQARVARAGG